MNHPSETLREPSAVLSVRPVVVPAPGRGDDLRVRISVPTTGNDLPIVIFSHGFGSSHDGYSPLVDFWAANGFAVIQPTHLDSPTLNISPADLRFPEIWRSRVEDITRILNQLSLIEASFAGIVGRLDRTRIAAAGHSWGAQTIGMLLGARVLDSEGVPGQDMSDSRITAGVLLAATGRGGAELTPFARTHLPFMNPCFAEMTTPTLVIAGDRDQSALSDRGPDWFTDPYYLSPGPKSLLTLFGAEHSLGGISGYSVTDTTDENPDRVALIQQITTAYLRSALYPTQATHPSWPEAAATLPQNPDPLGRIESK